MTICRNVGLAAAVACAIWSWSANGSNVMAAEEQPTSATAAGAHAKQAEEPNLLAFSPDLAIFSAIVFLLLLGLLSWFAWPQITAALDERERKIADNIAAAEARHEDAKRLLAEHEAKLAAAAGEIRALFEDARRDADHTRQSIEAQGHKAAQDELARAVREIERARDAAVRDLAVASANVAIDLAQKVIREQLTPEKSNQIVRDAVAKLAAAPSRN